MNCEYLLVSGPFLSTKIKADEISSSSYKLITASYISYTGHYETHANIELYCPQSTSNNK